MKGRLPGDQNSSRPSREENHRPCRKKLSAPSFYPGDWGEFKTLPSQRPAFYSFFLPLGSLCALALSLIALTDWVKSLPGPYTGGEPCALFHFNGPPPASRFHYSAQIRCKSCRFAPKKLYIYINISLWLSNSSALGVAQNSALLALFSGKFTLKILQAYRT